MTKYSCLEFIKNPKLKILNNFLIIEVADVMMFFGIYKAISWFWYKDTDHKVRKRKLEVKKYSAQTEKYNREKLKKFSRTERLKSLV